MLARRVTLLTVALLAGCAGQGLTRDGTALPDAGSPAAQLYVERCGGCHAVPHPGRHSYAGWLHLVPLMEQRMAERGMRPLTDRERDDLLGYLRLHSR
ncbi:MAG: hypothetical protein PVJ66_07075 [Gammaproteobacteria bacterium]|jgi:hypothetical protein